MFEAIGDIVGGSRPQRERTPVRRQSRAVGRCEGAFWRRTDWQTVRKVMLAARRYEKVLVIRVLDGDARE